MTFYIDDDLVSANLSIRDAFECVDRGFRSLAQGDAINAIRRRSGVGGVVLNVMWALAPDDAVMGVKSYPVVRSGTTQGAVLILLLYSMESGELLAMIKADRLGQLRTGAATGVATAALARPDSEVLSVYGTGFQAGAQIAALIESMPNLKALNVVGRNPGRRDSFIRSLRETVSLEINAADPEGAARAADVIVTATGASDPVLLGEWVKPGTHINAVGSNLASKREVDRGTLERAAVIVVDDRDVAAVDCGDLILNHWDPTTVGTIGDVLIGRSPGRTASEDVTVFQSQGIALQDVVCAAAILRQITRSGGAPRIY